MNFLRTGFLLVLLTLLLVWAASALGFGKTGMIVALCLGIGFQLVNFFFSDRIVLKAYGARILEEGELQWLQDDVREMAERAGLPTPRVAYIAKSAPNASRRGEAPARRWWPSPRAHWTSWTVVRSVPSWDTSWRT